jgi:hypothetical protein
MIEPHVHTWCQNNIQSIQDYVKCLIHWELVTQLSIAMIKEKEKEMEVAENVKEKLVMQLSTFVNFSTKLLIPLLHTRAFNSKHSIFSI